MNDGFKSDICCYVEDGMVYASVYIGGKTSKEVSQIGMPLLFMGHPYIHDK